MSRYFVQSTISKQLWLVVITCSCRSLLTPLALHVIKSLIQKVYVSSFKFVEALGTDSTQTQMFRRE